MSVPAATNLMTCRGRLHAWPETLANQLPTDHWLVLHTRPRQEKAAAADLARRGIGGCLFLEERLRRYPKGVQRFDQPLLASYLFVHLPRERRDEAFAIGRVLHAIDVSDAAALTADLTALRRMLEVSEAAPQVRPELQPGRPVRIQSGTFAGCTGIIARRRGTWELVVNLPILGQSVATVIPADYAEEIADEDPGR